MIVPSLCGETVRISRGPESVIENPTPSSPQPSAEVQRGVNDGEILEMAQFARDEGLGIALVQQSRVVRRTRVRTGLRVGGLRGRQGEFAGRIRRSKLGKRRVFRDSGRHHALLIVFFRSSRDFAGLLRPLGGNITVRFFGGHEK